MRKWKRTRKHKTSRGAGSESMKNLNASTSLVTLSSHLPPAIPSALKQALSLNTWESLSDEQRLQLIELLPQSLSAEDKHKTLRCLFSGGNLTAFASACSLNPSGNPVDNFIAKLECGYYSKEACSLRKCQRKAVKAKANFEKSRYYHELLKEVVVSRQCHLSAITFPQCYRLARSKNTVKPTDSIEEAEISKAAESLYNRILHDVKQEAEASLSCSREDLLSSESDSDNDSSRQILGVKSLQSGSTSSQIKDMLIQHQRRLAANVDTPDLRLSGTKLVEVKTRTYGTTKKTAELLRKRKRTENGKFAKQKKLKLSKLDKESKKERKSFWMKERATITAPSCYFELIRDVIKLTSDRSLQSIQLLVSDWLTSAEASRYDWTNSFVNWHELVQSALTFLANHEVSDNNDSSLVSHENDSWTWKSDVDSTRERAILQNLCREWLVEAADHLITPSPEKSVHSFHEQERRRFLYAHQAFVYNVNGKRYPVPPVKGTAGPTREGKVAREHSLLKSERPPQVTLLALTRDAVARLPEGRGSRNLICTFIRDSQYLAPIVTDAQITAAVSGALDRLHYEPDPCVKYNSADKVWLYLHGARTPEELERIHSEQLVAPKKKRDRPLKRSKLKNSESKKKSNNQVEKQLGNLPDPATNQTAPVEKESRPLKTNVDQMMTSVSDQRLTNANVLGAARNTTGTRTIQVTQKQLLEMTRRLSEPVGGARELFLTPVDKKSSSPIVGTVLAKAQLPQSGLKLILKPGGNEVAKSSTEFAKTDMMSSPTFRSHGNQQILTPDALRRLTEQLSAMSSRPIKIVQRNMTSPQSPSGPGSRIINITSRPGSSNSKPSSSTVLPETVQRNTKTVFISRVPSADTTPHLSDDARILQIIQKSPNVTTKPVVLQNTSQISSAPSQISGQQTAHTSLITSQAAASPSSSSKETADHGHR